jgi:hypothetical protein
MTVNSDRIAVSLNGVDNIGKTTQLAWLHRGLPGADLVGTVDRWNTRWREVAAGDFAHWWFTTSTMAEHLGLLLESHAARRAASGRLALEDRGLPMLLATAAATAAVKDRLSPREALQLVYRLVGNHPVEHRREVHVLLRRPGGPEREAAGALRREPTPPNRRYAAYQHALAEILWLQADRGDYDLMLEVGDDPILDVQHRLRTRLRDVGIAAEPLPDWPLERLWVLAGMSEAGKSTVGELLRDEHGVTRLKFGYLLEVAVLRAGVADPYQAWAEQEQAERLSEETLRFATAAKARTVSLESAHRFDATAHLKRVWGRRCRVVYMDAPAAARMRRTGEPVASLRAREATKRERGAYRIKKIADHVIDNAGPLSGLKLAVVRLVNRTDVPWVVPPADVPVTQVDWLDQATAHILDDQVALVLATGCTGTAEWRDGWSDLDLLVVRDTVPLDWLGGTIGTLAAPAGVKLGISTFTTGDIAALRVPPRVLLALRRAAQGTGVLYCRDGYAIPVPPVAHGDRASRAELGPVLTTTRRLLTQRQIDVRAVHKHLVLIAKILLRADGCHAHAAEEVLAAFGDRHPAAGCSPPRLDDLIGQPDDPALRDRLTAAAGLLLAYVDRLDRTERTTA